MPSLGGHPRWPLGYKGGISTPIINYGYNIDVWDEEKVFRTWGEGSERETRNVP